MATVDNQKHYNQNISVSIAKYVNIHTKWIEKNITPYLNMPDFCLQISLINFKNLPFMNFRFKNKGLHPYIN